VDVSNLVSDVFVSVIEEEKKGIVLNYSKNCFISQPCPRSQEYFIFPLFKLCEIPFQFKIKNTLRYLLFVMLALKCLNKYFMFKEFAEYDRHKNVNYGINFSFGEKKNCVS
jgi:hypothetical protein